MIAGYAGRRQVGPGAGQVWPERTRTRLELTTRHWSRRSAGASFPVIAGALEHTGSAFRP
jgi:hypothetical protein